MKQVTVNMGGMRAAHVTADITDAGDVERDDGRAGRFGALRDQALAAQLGAAS